MSVSDADSPDSPDLPIASVTHHAEVEQVVIAFQPGTSMTPYTVNYTVAINYTGVLRDDLTGLYTADFGNG